jgi:hypothetical protein
VAIISLAGNWNFVQFFFDMLRYSIHIFLQISEKMRSPAHLIGGKTLTF